MLDVDPASYRLDFYPPDDRSYEPANDERWPEPERSEPKFMVEPLAGIMPVLTGSWLIKGLLPSSGLGVIYGEPGCGKSFLALDMALHVATGRPWAGKKVKQAGVIYIAAEGGSGMRKRIYAARRHHNIPDAAPFGLIVTPPDLGVNQDDARELIACIRRQAKTLGFVPGLIILDTLASSMDGADENSPRDMGMFVSNARKIEAELKTLVVAVHHVGKDAERGMRGSSALHGASAVEWEVTETEVGRSVRVAKNKDGEPGLGFMFLMFPVEVGKDEDGDPVTTLVAEVSDQEKHAETSGPKGKKLTGQRAEFMKAVRMAVDDMGHVPPSCEHVPARLRCVTRQQVTLYADKLGFLAEMGQKVRRSTLDRHIRGLAGDGHLGQWGDLLWLTETRETR